MMKKKHILAVSTVLLMLVSVIACDAEVVPEKTEPAPEGTVRVALAIDDEKTLGSTTDRDIAYWEFMATPLFKMPSNERPFGEVKYWRQLSALNTAGGPVKKACDLGVYTSGEWLFELRALNAKRHVISVGSTKQVLKMGIDNTIHITMLTDRGDDTHGNSKDTTSQITGKLESGDVGSQTISRYGQLKIGLVTNKLDIDQSNLEIRVSRQKVSKNHTYETPEDNIPGLVWNVRQAGEKFTKWYMEGNVNNYNTVNGDSETVIPEGKTYYECTIPDLEAGPYVYQIVLYAKNVASSMIPIAGQTVDVTIIGNEQSLIKGTLLPNEYIAAALALREVGPIYGSINGQTYLKVNSGESAALKWTQTEDQKTQSKETATKYIWMADGNALPGETGEISFACPVNAESGKPAYGVHRISCVAVGDLGSLGCATIDVIFNPPVGPGDLGDFDWPEGTYKPDPIV